MSLSDNEVQKQIDQMVKFIQNEGREKAEEIDTTAEEDFNIEKLRIVQNKKKAIQALHTRNKKKAEVEKKIAHSTQLNNARLEILKAQDEHLTGIFATVKEQVDGLSTKPNYGEIITKLIVEGLLTLNEKTVALRCRKADVSIVEKQLKGAVKQAEAENGITTALTLSSTDFLPETCGGGVEFLAMGGKMRITNTLENRLDNACVLTLPAVRNILFGANPTRAFFD
eukprot:m.29661 g.29661  ORF g.29661 m.29661 type:complete len:226 (+) comp16143_c0_seq1:97-774(+)